MPLTLHRSPRVDLLADALAARLAEPSGDPFAPELVVVPAKGVERWLSQRLSHVLGAVDGDGVAANIDFRSPHALVAELVGAAHDDPWHPDRAVWPLLEVIDASLGQPWCTALTRHLGASGQPGDDRRHGRRWAVAHRLARLFASYAAQRPAMLARWESGSDTDGSGQPVDADLTWQPELWRRLVEHLDQPSPATRHTSALAGLADGTMSPDLPSRLSLFGHTRLSVTEVELIEALAQHRQVDIWLPHPSDALWQALRGAVDGTIPRTQDDSHLAAAHPLLATLGRDVRELQRTLAPFAPASVTIDAPVSRPDTLLGRLQSDLEANRAPSGDHEPDPRDDSIQIHACHGATRQVEVLREVILGLLADDPSLEPRDIVVMCPDIEQFAPLIEAAFGLGGVVADTDGWHPGQRLQVRLADRSLVQTNPVLGVVQRLLALSDGRAEVSTVLDLAASEPVRRRFGFSDDDLDEITRWADETGVRWAFDAEHREPFGLGGYVQNTWRFGLDRVLAGVAVSDDARRFFGPTLPYDAIGSSDVDLAGRLAEFLDRIGHLADRLSGARPAHAWVETLREAVSALTSVGWGDEWQIHQAERELAAIGADQADSTLDLRLSDVRALMADRLSGRPTRANFRTGSLTVCTMVPMRSVPHRVVCLLGLDDGVFPRAGSVNGDDVLLRRPLTGERDARSEDRQLLLDAVLAAGEHLVITYAGANEITGRGRPASVPLGELIDAVRATAPSAEVVHHHPLQAFDPRNFADRSDAGRPTFSFDTAARDAAVASRADRSEPPTLGELVLPAQDIEDVDLAALGAFLRAPVREFLRRRLGLKVFDDDAVLDDAIPVELDGLQKWAVGSAMLKDLLAGADPDTALQLAWRRGALPPGRLGWQIARSIAQTAAAIGGRALQVMGAEPEATSLDIDLELGGGRRLRGTVTGVHGDRVVNASFSSLGPRHHLDAWIPLLALSAAHPETAWTAGSIARQQTGAAMVVFNAVPPEVALRHLRDLVALRDLGLTRPLRIPLKTGYAMAKVGPHGSYGARQAWEGDRFDGERDGDHHPQVWGRKAPFSVLTQAEPGHDLAALADRLWRPILEAVMR